MHPKNPFVADYPFEDLVLHSPELETHIFKNQFGNFSINFGDKLAVKALNKALLKMYYAVDWDIPEKNLCPPIPGRLDYLLHVSDLVEKKEVRLLDIGTGANLIYPILGTCHFNWQCTASEVDIDAMQSAKKIQSNNASLENINIRHQRFKTKIFENLIQPNDHFDVVVCNPPFFKNSLNAQINNERKARHLNLKNQDTLNFGGKSNELWYKGGEEAFVKKMAQESEMFKTQVQWFTSLVSKKEHLKNIKRAINKTNPKEVKVIDMEQGHKKSRFVAWTFM